MQQEGFKSFAQAKRVSSFTHGNYRKKEFFSLHGKSFVASVRHIQYKPVDVVIYELDEKGEISSPHFSTLAFSLYEVIRKAYLLSREV